VSGFGFVLGFAPHRNAARPALAWGRGGRFSGFSKFAFDSVFHVGGFLAIISVSSLSLRECMYRRHGGHMFGDMVDGFRSSYLP